MRQIRHFYVETKIYARIVSQILAVTAACLFMQSAYTAPDFDQLLKTLTARWGPSAVPRFSNWRELISGLAASAEPDRLKRVNEFFNRQIRFGTDPEIWKDVDYWATPLETLGMGAGDCEDFVIAKYFTLQLVGVAPDKLRLTYVKAKIGGGDSTVSQAHMVLAYYTQPDAEPLVLDNLISDIRPASRRPDLAPVFSFNSDGIWVPGGAQPKSSVDKLSRWKDLVARMHAEGFDL